MQKGIDYVAVCVGYLCHDGNGNFLFNKRSKNCRDEHGTWDFGGGGLDFGDTVLETMHKELQEEYCVEPVSYEFLGWEDLFRTIDGKKTHWLSIDFLVLIDREKVKNGEPHKFDELGWFRLDNLPEPLHSSVPGILEKFRDRLAEYY